MSVAQRDGLEWTGLVLRWELGKQGLEKKKHICPYPIHRDTV